MTVRALVVERPGEIDLIQRADPIGGPEEVLVRPALVGLCGTDLEIIDGRVDPEFVRYPITLGHEWMGVVVSDGEIVPPGTCLFAASAIFAGTDALALLVVDGGGAGAGAGAGAGFAVVLLEPLSEPESARAPPVRDFDGDDVSALELLLLLHPAASRPATTNAPMRIWLNFICLSPCVGMIGPSDRAD